MIEEQEVAAPPAEEEVIQPEAEQREPGVEQEGDEKTPLRDDKGKFKGGAQARIDELTRRAHEAERRATRAEAEAVAAKTRSPESAPAKPTPDKFEDYGEFVEALADWKADQREAARAQEAVKTAAETDAEFRQRDWSSKVEASKATLTDFDEVVGKSEIPIKDHVAQAIMEADQGPELIYHFAQNPDALARLNEMSPAKAAIELGKIEATLDAPPTRAASRAPAPINPVRQGSSAKVNLATAPMDTYITERRKQGARF